MKWTNLGIVFTSLLLLAAMFSCDTEMKTSITGTLSYGQGLEFAEGTGGSVEPVWTGQEDANQTFSYSISPSPAEGITFDPETGILSIGSTVLAGDYTYTVRVQGQGSYGGRLTAIISFSVFDPEASVITGTFSYERISVDEGSVGSVEPVWTGQEDANQTLSYSISPSAAAGITFDSETGILSIGSTALVGEYSYTVTAQGRGNYRGTITAELFVVVIDPTVPLTEISGTFTYSRLMAEYAFPTSSSASPVWSGQSDVDQTLRYSIDPAPPSDLSFNSSTGVLTLEANSTMDFGEYSYTVSAEGFGTFRGTKTAALTLEISPRDIRASSMSYSVDEGYLVNTSLELLFSAGEVPADAQLSYEVSPALPAGLDFEKDADGNVISGRILGTPTSVTSTGNNTFTITVRGSGNYTGSLELPITLKVLEGMAYTGSVGGHDSTFTGALVIPKVFDDSGTEKLVTSIAITGFQNYKMTSVSIPDSVTSIGVSAFSGCTSLTSVTIPVGVTSIGLGAFQNCTSLTSVTIPLGVTSIGFGAFLGTSLTSVTIPFGVTSIEESLFQNCTSLASVTIPASVTTINVRAFGNTALKTVRIEAAMAPSVTDTTFTSIAPDPELQIPAGSQGYPANGGTWGGATWTVTTF